MYEEWKCACCCYTVWRSKLASEVKLKTIPYTHSIISSGGNDPLCPGHITRTGKTSPTYPDAVIPAEKYMEAVMAERTSYHRRNANFQKPKNVTLPGAVKDA